MSKRIPPKRLIALGLAFIRRHGRYPCWTDGPQESWFVSAPTIRRRFGSWEAYWTALAAAGASGAVPRRRRRRYPATRNFPEADDAWMGGVHTLPLRRDTEPLLDDCPPRWEIRPMMPAHPVVTIRRW